MRLVYFFLFLFLFLVGCQTNTVYRTEVTTTVSTKTVATKSPKSSAIKKLSKAKKSVTKADGPPLRARKLTFKEPKPAKEALSRYGNPPIYYVNGHTYEVMRTTLGYKTRGIASWYGTKFHKQRTSSGDPYDMYAMTCAHKTLPLPSYIKVTNLSNGRVAVVKVNDRGPFHSDRVIDLSYAAALKLGVLPKGTAPVEIEILQGKKDEAHFYLQAGAFGTMALANQLKAKIRPLSKSAVLVERYNKRYIVRVGPFTTRRHADEFKKNLAAHGIKGVFSVLR